MITTSINVQDMHCSSCSNKISTALLKGEDVHQVNINPLRRDIFVTHDMHLKALDIVTQIAQLGFSPKLLGVLTNSTQEDRLLLKRLGIAGICMMQVMMIQVALYAGAWQDMQPGFHLMLSYAALIFSIPVATFSAIPFFHSGLGRLKQGVNMDTPIALAVLIAFSVSVVNVLRGSGEVYFDSVTMFVFLMLGARYIDQRLRGKLHLEDQLLANLPRQVTRVSGTDGAHETVSLKDIQRADKIWVAEGEMIPVDGSLLSNQALINTSLLTGEAEATETYRGKAVWAGTVNQGAGILLIANGTSSTSRIAEINEIANHAGAQKDALSGLADSIARVFIPSIIAIAVATYCYWSIQGSPNALTAMLAVLVVSCPCALSLAIPAANAAALTLLRRQGLLVRNPRSLEALANVKTVFFDKTGTLTTPTPRLVSTTLLAQFDAASCQTMAAALQVHSHHPIASAFVNPSYPFAPATNATVVRGAGISGRVNGVDVRIGSAEFCGCEPQHEAHNFKKVYLSVADKPAAIFDLTTPIRPDAHATVVALQKSGLRVELLSGDNPENCKTVADALDIAYHDSASPELKRTHIMAEENSLFVGDGLNDLPALATASVSAATFETVDLVKSKADVILMTPRLSSLLHLFTTARRARNVARQNLTWALLYNMIAIPLAASG
ncbi:MAG: Cu2+-exporting ATPase, partial [Candidatus Azotimanducaceae bacterium]